MKLIMSLSILLNISLLSSSLEYLKKFDPLHLACEWSDKVTIDCKEVVGYRIKTRFYKNFKHDIDNRISLFMPGYYNPRPVSYQPYPTSESFADIFPLMDEKSRAGWLPGSFFIINTPEANKHVAEFKSNRFWGQKNDAFAYIYTLNKLNTVFGIEEVAIHAQCYGTLRLINTLYYLSNNEQTREVEQFFGKAGIDRIQKEKLLHMITTISLQTPLKNAIDTPIAIYNKFHMPTIMYASSIACGMAGLMAMNNHNLIKSAQFLTGATTLLAANYYKDSIIRNTVLPFCYNYDNTEHTETHKLNACAYFKHDYPQMSLFMTTAKGDRTVGDWDVDTFFTNFPVNDNRKYLIPSPASGHCKVDHRQVLAKNAFLRRYKSSYHNFNTYALAEGHTWLKNAQKMQNENLQKYITYMEDIANYPYADINQTTNE